MDDYTFRFWRDGTGPWESFSSKRLTQPHPLNVTVHSEQQAIWLACDYFTFDTLWPVGIYKNDLLHLIVQGKKKIFPKQGWFESVPVLDKDLSRAVVVVV